ncbi:hypothetical protein G6F42_021748 [Rhizopus arrhizus]|nr:hypothetical protein G6F42_021748 [Rhizopus arrhizus]
METLDLHAARLSKPPEVSKAKPLSKDKIQKKVTKSIQKQKKQIIVPDSPMIPEPHEPMAIDQPSQPSVLVQPFTPTLPHQTIKKVSKPTNRNVVPITSKISYDVKEILERKADINVKDLLTVAPSVKRELFKAIKSNHTKEKNNGNLTLNFFEDDDVDTTAIYTDFYINEVRVRSMLDTGSAKTCMSKDVADKLQLVIDSPSSSIFTLGNGTKQASLGIVYDVPLNLGGNIIIPGSIEILPKRR